MMKQSPKAPAVYILSNKKDGVLYTGVTSHLEQRVFQHKNKTIKGFSARYNCDCLVYFEVFDDMENAIIREKQLKAGPRLNKVKLIEQDNPNWEDLYDSIH